MSKLNTFKENNYEICATFEQGIYTCEGCVWSSPKGCTIPEVFYPLTRQDMGTMVEGICRDLIL